MGCHVFEASCMAPAKESGPRLNISGDAKSCSLSAWPAERPSRVALEVAGLAGGGPFRRVRVWTRQFARRPSLSIRGHSQLPAQIIQSVESPPATRVFRGNNRTGRIVDAAICTDQQTVRMLGMQSNVVAQQGFNHAGGRRALGYQCVPRLAPGYQSGCTEGCRGAPQVLVRTRGMSRWPRCLRRPPPRRPAGSLRPAGRLTHLGRGQHLGRHRRRRGRAPPPPGCPGARRPPSVLHQLGEPRRAR
jgi:hypothetical protein